MAKTAKQLKTVVKMVHAKTPTPKVQLSIGRLKELNHQLETMAINIEILIKLGFDFNE